MDVVWKRHARERFFERVLLYGINYEEVEQNILKQKVKEKQKDGKIKTIFKMLEYSFTVIKSETRHYVAVITIWEANQKEVELWEKKQ